MQYISSDTNVWIDFVTIQKTELPFRLPYTYIMNKEAVENELLSPKGLGQELISYGLVPVSITIDEFFLDADKLIRNCGDRFSEVTEYQLLVRCLSEQTVMEGGKRRLRKKEI